MTDPRIDADRQRGLYAKYHVERNKGDKPGARYFVLDYRHDRFAREALAAYAAACEAEFPSLAADLIRELSDTAVNRD